MQYKLVRNVVVLIGSLAANLAVATTPFEGIKPNAYCLKQICIGAPISSVPDAVEALTASKRLVANPCRINPLSYQSPPDAEGISFSLSVINDPSMQDKPVGEYYRIVRVQAHFPKALSSADSNELIQELKARMGLSKEGRRDIVSSYKGLMPRSIQLRSWPNSIEVTFDTGHTDHSLYEQAPGCSADKKPAL